ncbi:hypothetical protein [uncultured Dokdonia sp.]|uniref:hypothetical protein n=1 Tax=uncultured Dokdonia sp. TaxID=575653 RepID=UPI0026072E9B|nr:hypothetical protein [uncultured Dokdonia sp.]
MKHHRNAVSEKQKFISILDGIYSKSSSQQAFFKEVQQQGLEIYSQRGKAKGIKGKRKFRFKTLGYTPEMLKLLDKKIEKNVRLEALKRIRENQQEHSMEKERTRKRSR